MTGETIMPNLAKTTVLINFSKLIALNAVGTDAEVFGANTAAILTDMVATVQDVVGPSVYIEVSDYIESVIEIPGG
jgi:hypothetical protein